MPPLTMMIKPASSACTMRCRYCFYADVASHRETADMGRMDMETMRTLIRRVFRTADSAVNFSFQGGEPTLAGLAFFRAFTEEVDRANGRYLPVTYALQTNGYHLDEALLDFFAEKHFLLGLSMDGTRAVHDLYRRDAGDRGTYDAVLETAEACRQRKIPFNILCVVTEDLAGQGEKAWENLKSYGFLQFIPCIDDFDGPDSYSLSPRGYGRFLIDTFDCYARAWYRGQPVSERLFDNYLSILLGNEPESCGMSGSCGNYFLCEADGSIYPCDFYVLDEWCMGNVRENSLSRMAAGDRARYFRESSLVHPKACGQCRWESLCRGGCRRNRETPSGENRFCESYRMFFEARGDKLMRLAKDIAERNHRDSLGDRMKY